MQLGHVREFEDADSHRLPLLVHTPGLLGIRTSSGWPQNISVADAGGNLVAHARMNGAWIGSVDISINKAFTARMFNIPTQTLAEDAQSGGQFFGMQNSNDGRVMTFAGGIPLQSDGEICGAGGVSGGTGDQDRSSRRRPPRLLSTGATARVLLMEPYHA